MKEVFVPKVFRAETMETIAKANAIIEEYSRQGFKLTLRQLYYQFVARGLIENRQSEYKRLGSIVNDGRLAGLIDWESIEDRTRNVNFPRAWESPEAILGAVADQYQEDPWRTQRYAVEVWIEKEALLGVIEPTCERNRVAYFACRGYTSQSESYAAGKRLRRLAAVGREPVILHLGDHDPSGLDMTRDNDDRLRLFSGVNVDVRRLALNWDQVQSYKPPPNPAKDTDARFTGYQSRYGDESWELDALDPTVIDGLIQAEIDTLIDRAAWDAAMAEEEKNKAALAEVSVRWEDVADWLRAREDE